MNVDQTSFNLVDLADYPGLQFDIRYARPDNFIGRPVYSHPKAFLLKHVAEDLYRVHQFLKPHGFGLLIFDGYRPWSVTQLFWQESSEKVRQFLANPEKGSSHNRGCAVDLSMVSLETRLPVEMPSDFDEMNERSYADYAGGTESQRRCRDLLKEAMLMHGFQGIRYEWWHFNHHTHLDYPVLNLQIQEVMALVSAVQD